MHECQNISLFWIPPPRSGHHQGLWTAESWTGHSSCVTPSGSCTNALKHTATIIFCFRHFIPWVLHSLIVSYSSRNTLCTYITFHIFMYIYINTNKLMNQSLHFLITIPFTILLYHYITNASKHYTLQIFNFLLIFISTIANKSLQTQ